MATPVEMPKLGNTVEECILGKWRKNQGDNVAAGEVIAEIETDKATFDLTAPVDGTFLGAFFAEGALVPVFTNICVIGNPGESIEQFKPAAAATPAAAKQAEASPTKVTAAKQAAASPASAAGPAPAASEVFLSPRARRFAAEHGFAPPPMAGSGPGGRVVEQDLKDLRQASPKGSSLARKRMAAGYEARHEGSGINGMILARDLDQPPVRMSSMRERIARRMRESLSTSAQYTMNTSADATGMLSLRAKIKAARQ
ncbi:MAG: 2-oxo acid dehydrogenase subunit E2, partial [Acidobacteriales bacterium]